MFSPIFIICSYFFILISIPFIINVFNLGDLIPKLANIFNIDYYFYKIEPIVLCLGLITFYVYVFLGFLTDVIQHQYRNNLLYIKLENGSLQLRRMFPPFVISSVLLYMNTNRFDSLRNSFIMFQTFLLILLPVTHLSSRPLPTLFCKFFYRSVLVWSLIYALFPREAQYYVSEFTHLFNLYLGLDSYPYYHRSRYFPSNVNYNDYRFNRQGYGQHWMLY